MATYDDYLDAIAAVTKVSKILKDFPAAYAMQKSLLEELNKMTLYQARAPAPQKPDVEFDTALIDRVDNYVNMKPRLDHVKYNKVSEALASGNIYGVMISINGICYVFKSEEVFDIFQDRFKKTIVYDFSSRLHKINVYHITPPDVKQKARLKYLSTDEDEIQTVVHRLAELSNTPEDSIEVHSDNIDSSIIMAQKLGTWDELSADLAMYEELLREQGDTKVKLYAKARVGDAICPAEFIELVKGQGITINHYVMDQSINVQGNNHGVMARVIGADPLSIKKKKKKTVEDIAEEWITKNEYKAGKTRGEYYTKYKKCMSTDGRSPLSIQNFAKVMESFGYVAGNDTHKRIWEKEEESGEESSEGEDSD